MKKNIKLKKGLTINKEAITKLQESQMAKVVGGSSCLCCSCNVSCQHDSCNTK